MKYDSGSLKFSAKETNKIWIDILSIILIEIIDKILLLFHFIIKLL